MSHDLRSLPRRQQLWPLFGVIGAALTAEIVVGLLIGRASVAGGLVIIGVMAAPLVVLLRGAPLWIFLGLYPLLSQWQIGGNGTLTALTLLCIGAWILGMAIGTQPGIGRLSWVDALLIAFFTISFFSIATRTIDRPSWYLRTYAINLALYFLVRHMAGDWAGLRRGLWAFVAGTGVASLIAIADYARGVATLSEGINRLGLAGIGVNNFAAILLAGAAIALGLALFERSATQRLVLLLGILLPGIAIVLSQSRGAFVAEIALVAIGTLLVRRSRQRVILLVVALIFCLLLIPGISARIGLSGYAARMWDLITGGQALESERPYLWAMALTAFKSHPIFGIGVGNFLNAYTWVKLAATANVPSWVPGPQNVHNFYLATLSDVGLVGAIPLAIAMARCGLGIIRQAVRFQDHDHIGEIYAVALGFSAYFVAVIFVPVETLPLPYLMLGLVEAVRQLVKLAGARQLESAAVPATPASTIVPPGFAHPRRDPIGIGGGSQ